MAAIALFSADVQPRIACELLLTATGTAESAAQ
jgi:hypothetical protein